VELNTYRCARSSVSLESFHLHITRFIPGLTTVLFYWLFFYRATQKIQFYQLRSSDFFAQGDNFYVYAEIFTPILSFIQSFYSLTDCFISVFHYVTVCLSTTSLTVLLLS